MSSQMALVTPNPSSARSGGKRDSQIENTAMGRYLLLYISC
jgi:hypothetical protein